ncbi:hypothetical protein FIBSPDRAFT_905164 [Athelia psychrophila]|uniref:Uncharacterized protein n=1 Tax=Athelia psychrophila TaxID=1759441 RepID=A0A167TSZ7_9AGAM|nr:hypothetical protein FIBSPDRAFT_905164 [Fibularhizoctonia sp. CBS 109695]
MAADYNALSRNTIDYHYGSAPAFHDLWHSASQLATPLGELGITRILTVAGGARHHGQYGRRWARSASPMFWQPLGELGIANNMVIAGGVRHATTFLQPLGELGIANNMVIAGGVRHATTFLQPLGELGIANNMVIAGGVRHAPTFLQPLGELRWEEFIH